MYIIIIINNLLCWPKMENNGILRILISGNLYAMSHSESNSFVFMSMGHVLCS